MFMWPLFTFLSRCLDVCILLNFPLHLCMSFFQKCFSFSHFHDDEMLGHDSWLIILVMQIFGFSNMEMLEFVALPSKFRHFTKTSKSFNLICYSSFMENPTLHKRWKIWHFLNMPRKSQHFSAYDDIFSIFEVLSGILPLL